MAKTITELKQTGRFNCSDPALQRIWETGVNTLSTSLQDQYRKDARVCFLANYYVFGDTQLAAEYLNHPGTDHNVAWVMMLKDYSDYTASSSILEKLFSVLRTLVDEWCASQELLVSANTSDNAFYYKALMDASELAARARDFACAEAWRERAKLVKNAINELLWDDAKGVYAECRAGDELSDSVSDRANYLAIAFDVADGSRTQRILEYLDSHKSSDISVDYYILEALAKASRHQQALDMVRRIDMGALPIYWLMKHIAGIHLPDATSRLPYIVNPHLCDLKWVKAKVGGVRVQIP